MTFVIYFTGFVKIFTEALAYQENPGRDVDADPGQLGRTVLQMTFAERAFTASSTILRTLYNSGCKGKIPRSISDETG